MELTQKVEGLQEIGAGIWAWKHYLDTIREVIADLGAKSIIEIGGGRSPSFTEREVNAMGVEYTSNDISARELSLAPVWVGKALFDIQTPERIDIEPYRERYDFAFSKMVMEHVADYERAYANIHAILRPGGVAIAFHPVLYSMPFLVNRLLPEAASDKILRVFFPNRNESDTPKFPAVYSGCRISLKVRDNIKRLGFREVWQVPFYGHNYYSRLPVVRDIHNIIDRFIMMNRITWFATFAYTIVRK
jgi:SAM-dependent methyltransferase